MILLGAMSYSGMGEPIQAWETDATPYFEQATPEQLATVEAAIIESWTNNSGHKPKKGERYMADFGNNRYFAEGLVIDDIAFWLMNNNDPNLLELRKWLKTPEAEEGTWNANIDAYASMLFIKGKRTAQSAVDQLLSQ